MIIVGLLIVGLLILIIFGLLVLIIAGLLILIVVGGAAIKRAIMPYIARPAVQSLHAVQSLYVVCHQTCGSRIPRLDRLDRLILHQPDS